MSFRRVLATVLLSLACPNLAYADVPPPPDYVEKCTIERVRGPAEVCESCGTYFGEPKKCAETLGSQGMQHRCRTGGASTWTEIWCKPAAAASPATTQQAEPRTFAQPPVDQSASPTPPAPYDPVAPPPRGCGGCAMGARPGAVALLLAGAALAWILQARRPRA